MSFFHHDKKEKKEEWEERREEQVTEQEESHPKHKAHVTHELLGGAAAFEAAKAYEDHQKKAGKEVKHEKLVEFGAAALGFVATNLAETKGRDGIDYLQDKRAEKKEHEREEREEEERRIATPVSRSEVLYEEDTVVKSRYEAYD